MYNSVRSVSIEPEDRPPQFTMRIRDRRVQTTYPVRLTCQVIGYPVPEITWYKNGTEIVQDGNYLVLINATFLSLIFRRNCPFTIQIVASFGMTMRIFTPWK